MIDAEKERDSARAHLRARISEWFEADARVGTAVHESRDIYEAARDERDHAAVRVVVAVDAFLKRTGGL
jgi:hypothetical protein